MREAWRKPCEHCTASHESNYLYNYVWDNIMHWGFGLDKMGQVDSGGQAEYIYRQYCL